MAEVSQYKIELREIAQMILERQGVTKGRWAVGVNFNVGGAEAGPSPELIRPSMLVSVDSLNVTLAPPNATGPQIIDLDALAAPKAK